MKENIFKTNLINILIIICLCFSGCTDMSIMSEEAKTEFNESSVSADSKNLTESSITFASGDTSSSVTSAFLLPISGEEGSSIIWSSSNTEIITIADDGSTTVTRPSGSNATVTLTATITKGSVKSTKTFTVTVLAADVAYHTITFNASGGSGSMGSQTVAEGVTASLNANAFTYTGHTFSGWATSAGGSVAYADGGSYTMGSSDVTLYAVWTALPPASHAITFNANGGSGSMGSQSVAEGATASLNANAYTYTGHTFSGWATTAGGLVAYTDGADYTMGSSDVTLYAVWAAVPPSSHTITFNANGGSGSMSTQTIHEGASVNLNANSFTYAGHAFSGWAETPGGSVAYTDGGSYTMGVSDVILYAVWIANTHTITFNANGGSGSMSTQTIHEGASVNLNANSFTYAGHTFSGWATTAGGTVAYADGADYTMGSSDVTLYAVWRLNISISSITPDGETSVSSDTDIVIVFSDSLDGKTKGAISFASPAVTFTDGVNASITFSSTNKINDTIRINPTGNLQQTNYTSITVSGFRDSYSSDVTCSDSAYYFPVRGAMDLYFPFTNGSLTDASGRGVTLVPSGGPALTAGHDGSANGAYRFDGTNDYMQVNGDLGIDCDADFTISAWIYLTSIANYRAIVSNYHTTGANGLMFRVNSNWAGHTNALDLSEGYSSNGVLSTGRWLHVVAVYTEATSKVQFYVNGAAAGYTSTGYNIGDPLLKDSRNKFAIGADYLIGGARYFPGTIDEVRFYKYALTAGEVANLYNHNDIY